MNWALSCCIMFFVCYWIYSLILCYGFFLYVFMRDTRAPEVMLVVKNPPADAGDIRDMVQYLGWEDPLEAGMATHSSILAQRTPQTEKPGGLYCIGPKRVGHNWSNLTCMQAWDILDYCFVFLCNGFVNVRIILSLRIGLENHSFSIFIEIVKDQ